MDERTKEIMLANLQEVANRRLDVQKAIIEDKKQAEDPREQGRELEQNIREIQNTVRFEAATLPPLPPLSSAWPSSVRPPAARTSAPTRSGWLDGRSVGVDGAPSDNSQESVFL